MGLTPGYPTRQQETWQEGYALDCSAFLEAVLDVRPSVASSLTAPPQLGKTRSCGSKLSVSDTPLLSHQAPILG